MRKGLFVLFLALALLIPLGSTFAETPERIIVDSRNGVDYAITLGEHSPNSGGLSIEEAAKLTGKSVDELEREFKLQEDLDTIVEYVENNFGEDKTAGIHLEGNTIVLNLTENFAEMKQLHNELLTKLNHPNDLEIRVKKYSIEELKEMRSKLPLGKFGITGVGLDKKGNKVNVYISEQNYKKYKEEIIKYLDEELITWVFQELIFKQDPEQ